ncbi:MAG: hypothetical protein BroJett029_36740 [Alphaproteobacteria bacterium]|nr:MAG: hypothetical protein BroJett029_36740 [Alphaproteobacteria bacterium]
MMARLELKLRRRCRAATITDDRDMIDRWRYDLDDPAARHAIVAEGRRQLRAEGFAALPGLVTPAAAAVMAEEGLATLPRAHRRDRMLGAYDIEPGPDMAADHPVRRRHPYCMHVTATDLLPPAGMIRGLYERDDMTELVADLLEETSLHRCADPLLSCAVTIMGEGDQHGWHFDSNDLVVTLLLQKPEQGGDFEFCPGIRSDADQNFAGVAAAMDGAAPGLRRPCVEAGTLMLFRGKQSIHRVTPVAGPRRRVIAIFSYDRMPGMMFSERTRLQAVGRTAA